MCPQRAARAAPRLPPAPQVDRVARLYPGRASMSPLLDLLITLLHWGQEGWRQALAAREQLFLHAQQRLAEFAEQHGERVLCTPCNPISLALTLTSFDRAAADRSAQAVGTAPQRDEQLSEQAEQQERPLPAAAPEGPEDQASDQKQQAAAGGGSGAPKAGSPGPGITFLGSMLFNRCVSGTRVVARGKRQEVGGLAFAGYGAHTDAYPCDYLTVAAALGTSEADIDQFLLRLGRAFEEFRQRRAKAEQAATGVAATDGAVMAESS